MALERDLEHAVVEWAKKRHIIVWKIAAQGRRGIPDRVFILPNGVHVYIEFKRAKLGRASAWQLRIQKELVSRGVTCIITSNYNEAVACLTEALAGTPIPTN